VRWTDWAIELATAAIGARVVAGAGARGAATAAREADLAGPARPAVEGPTAGVATRRGAAGAPEIGAGLRGAAAARIAHVTLRGADTAVEDRTTAVARGPALQTESLTGAGLAHLTHVGGTGAGTGQPAATAAAIECTATAVRHRAALGRRIDRGAGRGRSAAGAVVAGVAAAARAALEDAAATVALLAAAHVAGVRHTDPTHVGRAGTATRRGVGARAAIQGTAAAITDAAACGAQLLTRARITSSATVVDAAFTRQASSAFHALARTAALDRAAGRVLVLALDRRRRRHALPRAAGEAARASTALEHSATAIRTRAALGIRSGAAGRHARAADMRQGIAGLAVRARAAVERTVAAIGRTATRAFAAGDGFTRAALSRAPTAHVPVWASTTGHTDPARIQQQTALERRRDAHVARRHALMSPLGADASGSTRAAGEHATAAVAHRAAVCVGVDTGAGRTLRARATRAAPLPEIEAASPAAPRATQAAVQARIGRPEHLSVTEQGRTRGFAAAREERGSARHQGRPGQSAS